MYAWIKLDVSQLPLPSITSNSLKCLLALASIMNDEFISQVSYTTLSNSLNISKRTAIRSIKELEYYQILKRINVPGQILTVQFRRSVAVGKNKQPTDHRLGVTSDFILPHNDTHVTKTM